MDDDEFINKYDNNGFTPLLAFAMNSSLNAYAKNHEDAQLYLGVVDKLMTRCGKTIKLDLKVGKEKRNLADDEKKVGKLIKPGFIFSIQSA